jgi:glutamate carboxypeptidase
MMLHSDNADDTPSIRAPGTRRRSVAAEVQRRLEPRSAEMADLLATLVRMESGTDDPDGLHQVADYLEQLFGRFGTVTRHPIGPGSASHLVVEVAGQQPAGFGHLAVLGHYDTVWPRGTLETMPVAIRDDGVLTGPGSFDMKGGIVLLYHALRELASLGIAPRRTLRLLLSCDEEVRSRTSRGLINDLAEGAAAALVFESPLPGGALKTSRKGTLIYRLNVEGRAAHAGIEPDNGVSAVEELARQVQVLHALSDHATGTTVNVGVARGGTRPNVVAARAEAEIDVRVMTPTEAERVHAAITGLQPSVPGAKLVVTADLPRPPMTATAATWELFARASAIWAELDESELGEGATGGASDANLVAALGVPTLDGLGPEGAGAHAAHEHVLTHTMPARAALAAGLMVEI